MMTLPADHPAFSEEIANKEAERIITKYNTNIKSNHLMLTNIRIKSLPQIPESVKYLYANSTKIETITNPLPELHLLSLELTPLTHIKTLPLTLKKLFLNNTRITELPSLPPKLLLLHVYSTKLQQLPSLPASLQELWVNNTKIKTLPDLPNGLRTLWVYNTFLEELPPLPDSLEALQTHTTHLIQRQPGEFMSSYIYRVNLYYEKKRVQARNLLIKEELMTVVWNPDRVSKWLDGMDDHSFNILIGED